MTKQLTLKKMSKSSIESLESARTERRYCQNVKADQTHKKSDYVTLIPKAFINSEEIQVLISEQKTKQLITFFPPPEGQLRQTESRQHPENYLFRVYQIKAIKNENISISTALFIICLCRRSCDDCSKCIISEVEEWSISTRYLSLIWTAFVWKSRTQYYRWKQMRRQDRWRVRR